MAALIIDPPPTAIPRNTLCAPCTDLSQMPAWTGCGDGAVLGHLVDRDAHVRRHQARRDVGEPAGSGIGGQHSGEPSCRLRPACPTVCPSPESASGLRPARAAARILRRRIRCRPRWPGSGFVSFSQAAASGIQGSRRRARHPRRSPPRRRESAAARRSPERADDALRPPAGPETCRCRAILANFSLFSRHVNFVTRVTSRIGADHEVEFVANATIRAVPVVGNGRPRSARRKPFTRMSLCVLAYR